MGEMAASEHRNADSFMTPVEIAERLRVTRTTVYAWLKSGRLRGLRAGKAWRVRTEDLESFMRGARSEPTGPLPASPDPRTYRDAILAVLRTNDSDPEARKRLFALPGGEDALKKVMDMRAARTRFAGLGISSDEYMREKRQEAERELLQSRLTPPPTVGILEGEEHYR